MKQSIMITIILVAVAFSGTFAIVMFYNTSIDTTAFAQTPGTELSNAIAVLKKDTDNSLQVKDIKNMSGVRKVQFIDSTMVKIEKNEVSVYVMEDYSKKETNTVYQGRYPLHSNEIAIAGQLAIMMKKTIGDNITLKVGDIETQFLITGLSQGASMGGLNAAIRSDGMLKLNPDFKPQNLQIYLNKNVNSGKFVTTINNLNSDRILSVIDMDKEMKNSMGVYVSIVSKVGISILVVTLVVVILVLYFVINSSIIRRKRELGIQKAIGFTTLQLMNQLSIGFLPPITLGVCIGSIIGIMQTNALMSLAERIMGIMKAGFIITPGWIALFGAAIVIVSYVTSMLITFSIRKISAYSLVTE